MRSLLPNHNGKTKNEKEKKEKKPEGKKKKRKEGGKGKAVLLPVANLPHDHPAMAAPDP